MLLLKQIGIKHLECLFRVRWGNPFLFICLLIIIVVHILLYVFNSEYKIQGSHLVKVTGEFLGIVCIFTIFSSFGSKRHYSSIKDQSHIINIQYALFRFFQSFVT